MGALETRINGVVESFKSFKTVLVYSESENTS